MKASGLNSARQRRGNDNVACGGVTKPRLRLRLKVNFYYYFIKRTTTVERI